MGKTKITFEVATSDPSARLGFETLLDNQIVFDTDHVAEPQVVTVFIDDNDAKHELKLVLKNKNSEHTCLTATGEIDTDAVLEIRNLAFADIPLGQIVAEQSVYMHDVNGNAKLASHQFFGVMGCNGTVTLKFTTPMYLWLLEHM